MDRQDLDRLDAEGYVVIEALTFPPPSKPQVGSLANPRRAVCIDGRTYWLKGQAQHGLASELIASRLADQVEAGPPGAIVRVRREALPSDGSANHLEGIVVGVRDQPGTENSKDLAALLGPQGGFDPKLVDAESRARVIAFQSWTGVGDPQVLVDLARGTVFSVDHGECFGAVDPPQDPTVVVTAIPGVQDVPKALSGHIKSAVATIEAIGDNEILEAVAKMPLDNPWMSDSDRRLKIAEWLIHRRDRLREVMRLWTQK